MSNIRISSQYLKNLSFKSPGAPDIFFKPSTKPNIELSIDLDAKKLSEESYEVIIKIKAEADKSEIFASETSSRWILLASRVDINPSTKLSILCLTSSFSKKLSLMINLLKVVESTHKVFLLTDALSH